MALKTQQIYDIRRQLNSWELSPEEADWEDALRLRHGVLSPEACQAGGPQFREAAHRAGLGFSPKDDSVISPPTQMHSGDICACPHCAGGSIGISWVRLGMLLNILRCTDSPNNRELSGPKC